MHLLILKFIGMIEKKEILNYLINFKNYFIVLPLASEYVLQMFKHA